jgi:hypothetical protein
MITANKPLKAEQIRLIKSTLWDTIQINWQQHDTMITVKNRPLMLPKQITVPLWDKFKVRGKFDNPTMQIDFMGKQFNTWFMVPIN